MNRIDEIEHPIIRTALQLRPVGPSLEIVSVADIPAGTGLGSSGTFTVAGLLRALHAYKRRLLGSRIAAIRPRRRRGTAAKS